MLSEKRTELAAQTAPAAAAAAYCATSERAQLRPGSHTEGKPSLCAKLQAKSTRLHVGLAQAALARRKRAPRSIALHT